jgi:hypothetical protein
MTCSFCTDLAAARNENNSSAFVAGCDNFRIETLRAHEVNKMSILFCNVHSLAKHRRPFTDYDWLCELDEKKGFRMKLMLFRSG